MGVCGCVWVCASVLVYMCGCRGYAGLATCVHGTGDKLMGAAMVPGNKNGSLFIFTSRV